MTQPSRRAVVAGVLASTPTMADFGKAAAAEARGGLAFPDGFLWGAATAGHQIEGNAIGSDYWVLENVRPTLFVQPSGDACDSYNRFEEDIALLASVGLNTYRFSLEWARIEPTQGFFSDAQLDHYGRMLTACRQHGVRAAVTFNHNVAPAWFAALGGWTNPEAPALFARFCSVAARALAAEMDIAFTLNEPQLARVLGAAAAPRRPGSRYLAVAAAMNAAAAKAVGSDRFDTMLGPDIDRATPQLLAAHEQGYAAIKAERSDLPVGACLAVIDFQPAGADSDVEAVRRAAYADWFEVATRAGDFVGVQIYNQVLIGPKDTPGGPPALNPESLGNAARFVHEETGRPVLITENGVNTADNAVRVRYIDAALPGLARVIGAGVPVTGYIHWSLLDNFEWMAAYGPKFGLIAVEPRTFLRTPKPSAFHLGAIARRNRI